MTNEEMKARFDELNAALVEKLGKQPFIPLSLKLDSLGWWRCGGAYIDRDMNDRIDGGFKHTPLEAFASAAEAIAKIPSEEERDLHEFQKMAAKLIDFGNEKGIDAKFLNPIVETARALASNALTKA